MATAFGYFAQAVNERTGPQLRDPQLDVTGGSRQQPVAVAVTLRRAGLAALVPARAPITLVAYWAGKSSWQARFLQLGFEADLGD